MTIRLSIERWGQPVDELDTDDLTAHAESCPCPDCREDDASTNHRLERRAS